MRSSAPGEGSNMKHEVRVLHKRQRTLYVFHVPAIFEKSFYRTRAIIFLVSEKHWNVEQQIMFRIFYPLECMMTVLLCSDILNET